MDTSTADFFLFLFSGNKHTSTMKFLLNSFFTVEWTLNKSELCLRPPNGPLLTSFRAQALSISNHYKLPNQCLNLKVTEQKGGSFEESELSFSTREDD